MRDIFEMFNKNSLSLYIQSVNDMKSIEVRGKREEYPEVLEVSNNLDELYVYEKIKLYCTELSYRNISNSNRLIHNLEDFKFINCIIEDLDAGTVYKNKGIHVFDRLRKLMERSSASITKDELEEVLEMISNTKLFLGFEDCMKALSFISNISIASINLGNIEFSQSFVTSNIEILNLHYSFNPKFKLPPGMYKNIITLAMNIDDISFFSRLKDERLHKAKTKASMDRYEWSVQFTEYYKTRIHKEDAKTYYHYAMGYIHFRMGQYIEAHGHLKQLKRKRGMFVNTSVKMLHLKVLYEGYMSGFEGTIKAIVNINNILESYRKLLADEIRKEQLGYQAAIYESFLNCFKALLRFQKKFDVYDNRPVFVSEEKKEREELRELFSGLPYHFKKWLIEKLDEIKQERQ